MKKSIYLLCVLLGALTACSQDDDYPYRDVARVQFVGSSVDGPEDMIYSFIWLNESSQRDTVYIPLRVLGGPAEYDRKVRISQITEYNIEYKTDNKGYVTDTIKTELPNKAVPGVHFVPFDSPEMESILKVKANEVRDEIPVILLRDKSLKTDKMRLRVQLEVSDDFQLGESTLLSRTIVFSDKLEQPAEWNKSYLGNYSVPKHELMIRVAESRVDDEWLKKGNKDKSFFVFWRGKFVDALEEFNNDPANIKSGKAPMRENPDDVNSPLVTFPNRI